MDAEKWSPAEEGSLYALLLGFTAHEAALLETATASRLHGNTHSSHGPKSSITACRTPKLRR